MENKKLMTISEFTNLIKIILNDNFDFVTLTGEISNFKAHSSGHRYFTLKDQNAQIAATMWKSRSLNFTPKDGMKVIVGAGLDVYPPRGNYQLDVLWMKQAGIGDLFQQFEELKKKLSALGYFDNEHKKQIPRMPNAIGISTSPTGAAVRDMIMTLQRRYPIAEVYFRPTIVQGDDAAQDIAKAIKELNDSPAELIIVGRGGGSIEDLWAYNTEVVANAIYKSKKPIISAVGHETDFTIADFVADLRASTPTAAAEIASAITIDDLQDHLENSKNKLIELINFEISSRQKLVDDIIGKKTIRRINEKINLLKQKVDLFQTSIERNINYKLNNSRQLLQSSIAHLNSLHPLSPLDKGFALLKSNGVIIEKNESIENFDIVELIRKNDKVNVKIIKEN